MCDLPYMSMEPFEAGFTVSAVPGDSGHSNLKPVVMNMGAPAALNSAALEKQFDQMPGFRFHPTDEELVGYYLANMVDGHYRKRILQLIPLIDLYRFDPWELPAMAASGPGAGEGPWFFFCPRDKKYPNGPRPNRVTHAGYWKATGTDRPVRSSKLNTIGLKKTLVFYVGRAPRGTKSNWVMNEYRLGTADQLSFDTRTATHQGSSLALANVHGQEKPQHLDLHAHEDDNFVSEWSAAFCYQSEVALCRIYKKAAPDPPVGYSGCEDVGSLASTLEPALGSNATTHRTVTTRDDTTGTCNAGPGVVTGDSITFSVEADADHMVGSTASSHNPTQWHLLPDQLGSITHDHPHSQSQEVEVQQQPEWSTISSKPRPVTRWMQLPSELSRSGLLDHIAGFHGPSINLHPRAVAADVHVPLAQADCIPDPLSGTSPKNSIKLWLEDTTSWLQSESDMLDSDPIPNPGLQETVSFPQRLD